VTSGINACEVETVKLLQDLLLCDGFDVVSFTLGLGLGNQAVVYTHLINVHLDEVFLL
jgi:hypothetical protein